MGVFRSFRSPFISLGGDPSPEIQITTGEQFDTFLVEFEKYLQEVGYFATQNQVVGEK